MATVWPGIKPDGSDEENACLEQPNVAHAEIVLFRLVLGEGPLERFDLHPTR